MLAVTAAILVLICARAAPAADEVGSWTLVLRPGGYVIGAALRQLRTRRSRVVEFDERFGAFEIALRKKAVAIPAPHCRMDYLILTIPSYYPENPKQASVSERRAVYVLSSRYTRAAAAP